MNCPHCHEPSLVETMTKGGVLVDVCKTCKGVWLDRGEVFFFSRKPKELERLARFRFDGAESIEPRMPALPDQLSEVPFLRPDLKVDRCHECEGYWFDAGELNKAMDQDRQYFQLETEEIGGALAIIRWPQPESTHSESERDERTHLRMQDLASGMLPLPNLWLRSAGMIVLLYGFLGLILVALAEYGVMPVSVAVAIGAARSSLQFVLGPWLMDLSLRWIYKFSWVPVDQLPGHLREFVTRVAGEQNMKVPSFGLIHDGAPNAFTYGHHPNNMRVVITQGILDLLEPEEVEGVVAHEIGHGKNWDMLLMTVVQLVPLLLYFLYRTALTGRRPRQGRGLPDRRRGRRVCVVHRSEYVVLWFSRCREYYADRFAGNVTGNPGALASALVKIGYGLAARGKSRSPTAVGRGVDKKGKKKKKKSRFSESTPLAPWESSTAKGPWRWSPARPRWGSTAPVRGGVADGLSSISKENLKSAMQWDLWNPWATFYELNSTHPLIAPPPAISFRPGRDDGPRAVYRLRPPKPESYWDEFAVDVLVILLPLLLCLLGLGVARGSGAGAAFGILPGVGHLGSAAMLVLFGLPILGIGIGCLARPVWSTGATISRRCRVTGLCTRSRSRTSARCRPGSAARSSARAFRA